GEGRRRMQVIGGNNRGHFDAVRPRCFRCEHLMEISVATLRRKPERGRGATCLFRCRRERPGDKFIAIVQSGSNTMNRTNKRPFTAADHTEPDPGWWTLSVHFDSHAGAPSRLLDAEHAPDLRLLGGGSGEIIECL